jgi:hypothetical protein
MANSTITGLVSNSVTIGSALYPSALTITATGSVVPTAAGAVGVTSSVTNPVLINEGTIEGGQGTHSASGTGGTGGIGVMLSGGTLTNSGSIRGGAGGTGSSTGAQGDAVLFGSTSAGTLIIDPGASFSGNVVGNTSATDKLILAGTSAGSITGLGTQFSNFSSLAVQSGASWTLTGSNTLGSGTGILVKGALDVTGSLSAAKQVYVQYGSLTVASAGTILSSATGPAYTVYGNYSGTYLNNQGLIEGSTTGAVSATNGGQGVHFLRHTTITNSGTILGGAGGHPGSYGGNGGIALVQGIGTLTNTGNIIGGAGGGASSQAAGGGGQGVNASYVTLTNRGTIAGGAGGNSGTGNAGGGAYGLDQNGGTLANYGAITGGAGGTGNTSTGFGGTGVKLQTVALTNHGTIIGGNGGSTGASGGAGAGLVNVTVNNYGTIQGGAGVQTGAGGIGAYDSNQTFTDQGTIIGGAGGSGGQNGGAGGTGLQTSSTAVTISGSVSGGAGGSGAVTGGAGGIGVHLVAGSLSVSGTISGGAGGASPATAGAQGDAVLFGTYAASVTIYPTAVFSGAVVADTAVVDTLNLASTSAATLSGLGTQFTGFSNIDFGTGADWTVKSTIAALDSTQTVSGFAGHDTIILDNFVETGFTFVPGTGLELSSAAGEKTIDFTGSYTGSHFLVTTDSTNTTISLCYLHGTRILTPTGEVPVEQLAIGDAVVTRFNGIQSIRWLGRQSYAPGVAPADGPPVCIKAGALGNRLPARDLYVSPGHSMLVDDTLVLARNLVNGITITQRPYSGAVQYVQIELKRHDCVIAEGTWSETYADGPGLRAQFHNAAEFAALYPDYQTPAAISLCAPRPLQGAALDRALRTVVARAALGTVPGRLHGCVDRVEADGRIHGWAHDAAHPDLPVLLQVRLDGEMIGSVLACDARADLAKAGFGRGHCAFVFDAPVSLPPAALGSLRIERASDGAKLRMSESCGLRLTPGLRLVG